MKRIIPTFLALLSICCYAAGQSSTPLDQYLTTALESNIALQQKTLSYEKSLAALQEAKGMFFPSLSIQARYSVARGGRAFVIPVGDLVNPIYDNLNLLNNLAQSANPDYPTIPQYPAISNVEENFLRPTEQETVVRLQMPLFNQAIIQNQQIQQNLSRAEQIGVDIYRRELVKEVKMAYYQYAQAYQSVGIYQNALELVQSNLRSSESLYENHKVTLDAVYIAKAQVEEVEQQLAEARKNERTAKAFFNFLLNRDYEADVELAAAGTLPDLGASVEAARQQALQNREELQQLSFYLAATNNRVQLDKGTYLPQINLQADYGIQGTRYQFDRDADFFLGSVVLSWNLFDRTAGAKVQQAKIGALEAENRRAEARQQIGLQVVNAFYSLEAAAEQVSRAEAEVEAARQAFRLVEKKYTQGQANQTEFINARTQLTNAQQSLSISRYGFLAQQAEFERATASYPLN